MSLIPADSIFLLAAALLSLATFGFWVEKTAIGKKLSGVLIILLIAVLFSNIGLIPSSAGLYEMVGGTLVPLAIPMLLFKANLKKVIAEIGPMLKAFIASGIAISISIITLTVLFDFGQYESEVAGTLAASYIGGSVNFVATAQAVGLTDPNHYVAALTADTIGAVLFLALLVMMPSIKLARKAMPSRYQFGNSDIQENVEQTRSSQTSPSPAFNILGLSLALTCSMAICAVTELLVQYLNIENYFILVITLFALGVANFAKPLSDKFCAEFEVATLFMYVFFVTIGASADLSSIAGVALPYVILICGAVVLFFFLILFLGRMFKLDLAELMIAANACILGPATAAALAAGQGWRDMVTPGMLTGILGYSVGTFIGVGITKLLLLF